MLCCMPAGFELGLQAYPHCQPPSHSLCPLRFLLFEPLYRFFHTLPVETPFILVMVHIVNRRNQPANCLLKGCCWVSGFFYCCGGNDSNSSISGWKAQNFSFKWAHWSPHHRWKELPRNGCLRLPLHPPFLYARLGRLSINTSTLRTTIDRGTHTLHGVPSQRPLRALSLLFPTSYTSLSHTPSLLPPCLPTFPSASCLCA
mmetsp:Transcript_49328/g.97183  ORF Transcript_49328/g.97183 Transcript_49328/m.97183 type:complete len:201 (-) Transcript_49328:205-807(-)